MAAFETARRKLFSDSCKPPYCVCRRILCSAPSPSVLAPSPIFPTALHAPTLSPPPPSTLPLLLPSLHSWGNVPVGDRDGGGPTPLFFCNVGSLGAQAVGSLCSDFLVPGSHTTLTAATLDLLSTISWTSSSMTTSTLSGLNPKPLTASSSPSRAGCMGL